MPSDLHGTSETGAPGEIRTPDPPEFVVWCSTNAQTPLTKAVARQCYPLMHETRSRRTEPLPETVSNRLTSSNHRSLRIRPTTSTRTQCGHNTFLAQRQGA